MKILSLAFFAATLVALQSCSSVKYGDAQETETVNIEFGSTDLQTLSKKMVKSLIDSPNLAYLDGPGKRDRAVHRRLFRQRRRVAHLQAPEALVGFFACFK